MTVRLDDFRRQSAVALSDKQIAQLRPFGELRVTAAGDVLFEVGDADAPSSSSYLDAPRSSTARTGANGSSRRAAPANSTASSGS